MEEALPKLLETIFLFLPRAGASLVIVLGFWILSVISENLINRVGNRTRLAGDVISLLTRASKVALVIFGIITALGTVRDQCLGLGSRAGSSGLRIRICFERCAVKHARRRPDS